METRLASGLRAIESKGFSAIPKTGIALILDSKLLGSKLHTPAVHVEVRPYTRQYANASQDRSFSEEGMNPHAQKEYEN